ncbi:hypothetical protein BDW62DRAFT_191046 [Aspergillus aurantiobrunneus]
MPLNIVRRGGGILRNLPFNSASALPIRVATSQHPARQISSITRHSLPASVTRGLPCSSLIARNSVRTYATESRSKDSASSKSKKPSSKSKKTTKPAKKRSKEPKKALTKEEQERRAAKKTKQLVKELKKIALQPPKPLPASHWVLAVIDKVRELGPDFQPRTGVFKRATDLAREISEEERERYREMARANRTANKAAYEAWVKSHSPLEIKEANQARRQLHKIKKTKRFVTIQDNRLVKKPRSSFLLFTAERKNKDMSNLSDESQAIAAEWYRLPESEKEKYREAARVDRERYAREYLETYGSPPPMQQQPQGKNEE